VRNLNSLRIFYIKIFIFFERERGASTILVFASFHVYLYMRCLIQKIQTI
jgi:hypothetical protein